MYYLFKLSESWFIVEEDTKKSRVLDKSQVEVLCGIFQKLAEQAGLLVAVEIKLVPTNKLMKLSFTSPPPAPKKVT